MAHAFKGTHAEAEEENIRQFAAMTAEESVRSVLELQQMLGFEFQSIRTPDCPVEKGHWPRHE